MTIPRRFALRTLLLLMLVVASIFGYAQWRRQQTLAEIKALQSEGIYLPKVRDNGFWVTIENFAHGYIYSVGHTDHSKGDPTIEEADKIFDATEQRLKAIGVTEVLWDTRDEPEGGSPLMER